MIRKDKQIPFLIALSFLAALVYIRLSVFLAGAADTEFARAAETGQLPGVKFHLGSNIILFGYHIHHFYIGILLICLAGWWALAGSSRLSRKHLAVMYGAGLGLFFDEIGLLLTWGDYYSQLTYYLSLFLAAVFLNIVFFHNFWVSMRKNLTASEPQGDFTGSLLKRDNFLKLADAISRKTGSTERAALLYTGVLYLLLAGLVYFRPQMVRYWAAIIFFIRGVSYLARLFQKEFQKMKAAEKISFLVTGLAYIAVGVLILTQPRLFYYWVAGIFSLQGAVSLLRALARTKPDPPEPATASGNRLTTLR